MVTIVFCFYSMFFNPWLFVYACRIILNLYGDIFPPSLSTVSFTRLRQYYNSTFINTCDSSGVPPLTSLQRFL
jgi:hypothetical protein